MKKVVVNSDIDEKQYQQKLLEKYQTDSFFIAEYNKIEVKKNNLDLLDVCECIESKRLCQNCDGLNECQQTIKGYYLELVERELKYYGCAYLEKTEQLKKRYHNLVYSTSPITKIFPSTRDLIRNKKRVAIFRHLDLLEKNKTKQGLYLSGPPGIGKTFIIEVLLGSYLENNYRCAYLLLNDFGNEMKTLYFSYDNDDKAMFNRLIKRLKNVDVLVIDDIGAEKVDAILRDEILFPILDYRMKEEKLTCFTANYSLQELEEHYAETSAKLREPIKAKRIIERIRVLSKEFKLSDESLR